MRKFTAVLLAVMLLATLTACGSTDALGEYGQQIQDKVDEFEDKINELEDIAADVDSAISDITTALEGVSS